MFVSFFLFSLMVLTNFFKQICEATDYKCVQSPCCLAYRCVEGCSFISVFAFFALIIVMYLLQNALKPALTTMILFVDLMEQPTFAIAILEW